MMLTSFGSLWGSGGVSGLYFTPNAGQWESPVVARCIFSGGAIFLRKDGFRIKLYRPEDLPNIHKSFHYRGRDTAFTVRGHAVDVAFSGTSAMQTRVETEDEAPFYENYYLGDQPDKWVTGLYPVRKVRLKNIYPNIDFVIYTRGEKVEFDWVVHPGGDPALIGLSLAGQDRCYISENGDLTALTGAGRFTMNKPEAKQGNRDIACRYVASGENRWELALGEWDRQLPLIIDPVLVFSTYSGSRGDNFGFTATYDSTGHLYAGGIVDNAQGAYPVTTGAFQTVYGGRGPAVAPVFLPCDVAISKYTPNGSALEYATYLGGRSNEYPHSLSIDENNNLLVLGTTLSNNFPIPKLTAFDSGYNGNHDLYVVKLSLDGKSMLGGTYIGGSANDGINTGTTYYNYADDFRGDILADRQGNIYVATCTRSSNFPVRFAHQSTLRGSQDAVVFSFNAGLTALRWSTYLGGTADDAAYSIKTDDSMNLFIGGGTSSNNFPIRGKVLHSTFRGGQADGFIARMTADSGKLGRSTYWGTPEYDQIYFLDYDPQQKIYATGQTEGNVNRSAGTYGKNGTSQFIIRLSNALDSQEIATTFGNRTSDPELSPCAFMVDRCNNIYFSGWGSDIGAGHAGTTRNLEISPSAHQKTTDNNDFYLIVLSKDAVALIYATYFGGDSSEDHVDGGTSRFDKRGVIYQSVCSSCPSQPPGLNDFPTTPGAAFPVNVSYRCSNASFKFDFNITYAVDARFDARPRRVCPGNPIRFNVLNPGLRAGYRWNFGDGNTGTGLNPVHLYAQPGKYLVTLRVNDTASCNKTDSMNLEVEVLPGPAGQLKIESEPCSSMVKMEVTGTDLGTPRWELDDTARFQGFKTSRNYLPGNYTIRVFIEHPASGCRDTLSKNLRIDKDSLDEIRLANVFTPNQDGLNDCYRVVGVSMLCDEGWLKIFNRWGERIYYSDLDGCWKGTVDNGKTVLPEGTYFYQIFIKGKSGKKDRFITGSVNLIR